MRNSHRTPNTEHRKLKTTNFMVHNMLTTCLMLIAFATSCDYVFAQDADKGESPEVEMLTLKLRVLLRVLDPDDHPVEGATVTPRGLRTKIERASWYGWNGKRHGEIPELLTDETGIAEVPFPKYVFEKAETGSVNLNVTHPDFVMFDDDRFVEAGETRVSHCGDGDRCRDGGSHQKGSLRRR